MQVSDTVKSYILTHQSKTQRKSGLRITDIKNDLNIPYNELKPILRQLHNEGLFKVREGVNEQLIF